MYFKLFVLPGRSFIRGQPAWASPCHLLHSRMSRQMNHSPCTRPSSHWLSEPALSDANEKKMWLMTTCPSQGATPDTLGAQLDPSSPWHWWGCANCVCGENLDGGGTSCERNTSYERPDYCSTGDTHLVLKYWNLVSFLNDSEWPITGKKWVPRHWLLLARSNPMRWVRTWDSAFASCCSGHSIFHSS